MAKSGKAKGPQRFNAEIREIMDRHGVSRKEACGIRNLAKQNGVPLFREGRKPGQAGVPEVPKMAVDQIARATEARINFLSATISGIRQQLEAYQEELGQLVGVAKVLGIDADIPAGNLVETE